MGFLTSLFGGLGKALGGAGSSISKGIGSLFGGGGGGNLLNSIGGLFGGGKPEPRQAFGNTVPFAQQLNKGQLMSSPYQQGLPGFSGMTDGMGSPKKSNSWLDSLFPGGKGQGIAGLAIPAIGDMFAPKSPKIPDINSLQNVQAFQNFKPGNSVSPAYQDMLKRNTDRLRDERIRNLQATYRSARPGTDYLTDTNYQRDLAEIERQVQTQMSDDLARAEGTFSSQEQERLSQLAQMDIYTIMAQTGMDAQEANDFKQMFSNVGNMFLTNATKKPGSDIMSLFGGN